MTSAALSQSLVHAGYSQPRDSEDDAHMVVPDKATGLQDSFVLASPLALLKLRWQEDLRRKSPDTQLRRLRLALGDTEGTLASQGAVGVGQGLRPNPKEKIDGGEHARDAVGSFSPSPQVSRHFARLYNGGVISHGLLKLGGRALDCDAASTFLQRAVLGALSRLGDYVMATGLAVNKELTITATYRRFLIAGIATRLARLSESEAVSVAKALVADVEEALDHRPIRTEDGELLKRNGELVLRLD